MESAKERARASAAARAKPQNKNSRLSNMQGRNPTAQGNSLSFFTEEADGLKLSPFTVTVICLIYIGVVVLLHIFGKVKGQGAAKVIEDIEDPAEAGDM